MNSNLFDNFAETFSAFVAKESSNIKRLFSHMMENQEGTWRVLPKELSSEMIPEQLFRSVVQDLAGEPESKDIRMNPEETIMRLIRQGIPKENISAKFKYLTASLPNADYRIYRETSGYPADTIRVTRNGCSVYISSGLTTEDTARFVLLLDGHLPEIDEAAETLFGELQRLLREKQKEMMALEIAKKAVDAQLAVVLPGMGIKGKYEIADGKIRLHLTRTYRAEVELPLEALQDFISDPELVESALKVEPVSTEPEKRLDFPRYFPPKYYRSNIVKNLK